MVPKCLFILLVIVSVSFSVANGHCIPKSLTNLSLLPNGTLSWSVSALESCEITHFHINIHRDGEPEFDIDVEVGTTSVDLTFIPFCRTWVFTVRALTVDSSSLGHILITKIPLPPDADIALGTLEVIEDDGLHLVWKLEDDKYISCADSYRVTISDEQNGDDRDIYVTQKSLNLDFMSPCVTYEFGVRIIHNGVPTEEGALRSIEYDVAPAVQNPPRLTAVNLGATTANTTWILDSLIENRCPIRNLYVDGGQNFNISIPVKDTIEREPVQVNLSSLRSNSMYVLRVSVENSGGVSGQSIVGVQTLDLGPGDS